MSGIKTILLVDDSKNDLLLTRIAFEKAGFDSRLQEVHNGEQAIAYLKGDGIYEDRDVYPLPSIMLLDLNMPKKDGFDVVRWVHAQPAFKHLSVIVLTASSRTEDVERAFNLGASSYLVKPSDLDTLAETIRCLRDWIQINHFPPLNDRLVG